MCYKSPVNNIEGLYGFAGFDISSPLLYECVIINVVIARFNSLFSLVHWSFDLS